MLTDLKRENRSVEFSHKPVGVDKEGEGEQEEGVEGESEDDEGVGEECGEEKERGREKKEGDGEGKEELGEG